jgi:hypothetical protein
MVSHIPFKNLKPIMNTPPMHVTTELVILTKPSGAGQFYINLVDGDYKGFREGITRVVSEQASTMGKTKPFRPCLRLIRLVSIALILSPASMDPEISLSKGLWTLPARLAVTGRPNVIILGIAISEFAKAVQWKTERIPPTQKVNGVTYDQN